MTTISANDLVRTRDCAVPGCTGETGHAIGLCAWHRTHGGPDQFGTPGSLSKVLAPKPARHPHTRRQPDLERLQQVVERTQRALAKAQRDHRAAVAELARAKAAA